MINFNILPLFKTLQDKEQINWNDRWKGIMGVRERRGGEKSENKGKLNLKQFKIHNCFFNNFGKHWERHIKREEIFS